jgi:hypothetical protein
MAKPCCGPKLIPSAPLPSFFVVHVSLAVARVFHKMELFFEEREYARLFSFVRPALLTHTKTFGYPQDAPFIALSFMVKDLHSPTVGDM